MKQDITHSRTGHWGPRQSLAVINTCCIRNRLVSDCVDSVVSTARWETIQTLTYCNDPLQEVEGLVYGGVRVKALLAVLELVMQDDFQALRQPFCFLLQSDLLLMHGQGVLLQFLIVPADMPHCILARKRQSNARLYICSDVQRVLRCCKAT